MSAVVGVDLSSRALDLVKLDEDSTRAEWVRCELAGKDAWERTLRVCELVTLGPPRTGDKFVRENWWDDVYLVAIEAPYGRGQAGTNAILNRVVGAVAASLPVHLRAPERCWLIPPHEWKAGLGLKGKPTPEDMDRLAPPGEVMNGWMYMNIYDEDDRGQNARDAYCLALFARDSVARAVADTEAGAA